MRLNGWQGGRGVIAGIVIGCLLAGALTCDCPAAETPRVSRDLKALYTFADGGGQRVQDRSGIGPPLDLKIEKPSGVG